jgi:hypothetical protein
MKWLSAYAEIMNYDAYAVCTTTSEDVVTYTLCTLDTCGVAYVPHYGVHLVY